MRRYGSRMFSCLRSSLPIQLLRSPQLPKCHRRKEKQDRQEDQENPQESKEGEEAINDEHDYKSCFLSKEAGL